MTELSPSPAIVAAVQAATTLPVFLFALLAGAIADIADRRRMLLPVNALMAVVAFAFAFTVWCGLMTPVLLPAFTFLLGTGTAFLAPAWQAIVPKLVPREELSEAIALNSMGINISRAIGPALAGVLIVVLGLAWPFLLNALSILVIIAALLWWTPDKEKRGALPPEHVVPALVAGVRFAMNSRALQLTHARAVGFFLFASAYWAMLPLIAREVPGGGATLYGLMLGAIGAGAVSGVLFLPRRRRAETLRVPGTDARAATLAQGQRRVRLGAGARRGRPLAVRRDVARALLAGSPETPRTGVGGGSGAAGKDPRVPRTRCRARGRAFPGRRIVRRVASPGSLVPRTSTPVDHACRSTSVRAQSPVGRPVMFGLALGGAQGVLSVLEHLRDELQSAMLLSGAVKVADLTPSFIDLFGPSADIDRSRTMVRMHTAT